MRKAKEILRLKYQLGLTHRQIGVGVQISHVSGGKNLKRAAEAGLISWPESSEWTDQALDELLRKAERAPEKVQRPLPEMSQLHQELARKGVTLRLLWEEYGASITTDTVYAVLRVLPALLRQLGTLPATDVQSGGKDCSSIGRAIR
jgi:hypothetical protein